jgi:hypothetical protein
VLRLRPDTVWREGDGQVIALDGDLRNYIGVTETGGLLWKALADGATREALADELVARYGVDAEPGRARRRRVHRRPLRAGLPGGVSRRARRTSERAGGSFASSQSGRQA